MYRINRNGTVLSVLHNVCHNIVEKMLYVANFGGLEYISNAPPQNVGRGGANPLTPRIYAHTCRCSIDCSSPRSHVTTLRLTVNDQSHATQSFGSPTNVTPCLGLEV